MNLSSFDWTHFRWTRLARRHALWLAMGLAVLTAGPIGCGGCGDQDSQKSAKQDKQASKKEETSSKAADAKKRRTTAYGLPLPPNVRRIEERGDEIRVKTRMSLTEVEAFLKARLTDYEVLRPGDKVRAIGLRDFMPQVYAYPYGPYSFVVYLPAEEPKAAQDGAGNDAQSADGARAKAAPKVKPINKRKHGEPVTDRTSDGKLLAPGARWGEPYTPPPGSPLHKDHFRSNFGRPYGEWVLQ